MAASDHLSPTQFHKISRWVYAGAGENKERIRHSSSMRGQWGHDATCSCGWDSKTGGAVKTAVDDAVWSHKVEHDAL